MTKKNLLDIMLLLFLSSCVQDRVWDYKLKIKNESKRTIVIRCCEDSVLTDRNFTNIFYYDTAEINQNIIKPLWSKRDWEDVISFSYNKKLNIYFFDVDTLKKYDNMNEIVKNKLWIKVSSYSKEELEQKKWLVVFNE